MFFIREKILCVNLYTNSGKTYFQTTNLLVSQFFLVIFLSCIFEISNRPLMSAPIRTETSDYTETFFFEKLLQIIEILNYEANRDKFSHNHKKDL